MNPEFGTTLVQHLNQSCVFVVLQSNIIKIKFDKAELGLRDVPLPRGGYSIYPWVGRYGQVPHTLNLFKTNIADFPTLFKTEFQTCGYKLADFLVV